ncbi:histone H1-like repetitive region-containing protein [Clostridium akagii]|uniref:histone H1-like repetitive region-containing protein n=2 Tax=Clostridium akagii TaxID=91623 RepID=UPI00047EAC9A|nr:histone H1-like repetitive region-containing protein [Clostridium akagii]
MYSKEKIYEKTWFMWATLILFAPVGIFLMWKYKRLNKVPRIIISCVFAICFVAFYGNQLNTYNTVSSTQTQANEQTVTNKKLAADKVAAKKVAADKVAADKIAADKVAADKAVADKAAADKAAADKAVADKAVADKVAADKAAADKAVADKAAADKVAESSSATAQSQNNEYTVYITKTGDKYHRAGCRYLSKSQIAISKSDAIGSGYSPCSVCNP